MCRPTAYNPLLLTLLLVTTGHCHNLGWGTKISNEHNNVMTIDDRWIFWKKRFFQIIFWNFNVKNQSIVKPKFKVFILCMIGICLQILQYHLVNKAGSNNNSENTFLSCSISNWNDVNYFQIVSSSKFPHFAPQWPILQLFPNLTLNCFNHFHIKGSEEITLMAANRKLHLLILGLFYPEGYILFATPS